MCQARGLMFLGSDWSGLVAPGAEGVGKRLGLRGPCCGGGSAEPRWLGRGIELATCAEMGPPGDRKPFIALIFLLFPTVHAGTAKDRLLLPRPPEAGLFASRHHLTQVG